MAADDFGLTLSALVGASICVCSCTLGCVLLVSPSESSAGKKVRSFHYIGPFPFLISRKNCCFLVRLAGGCVPLYRDRQLIQ